MQKILNKFRRMGTLITGRTLPTAPDVSDAQKVSAAAAALAALSGTLQIAPARLAPLRDSLERVAVSGDVSALFWDDDDETEADDDGYARFGSVAVVDISGVLLPTSSWWMRYMGYRATPEIAEGIRAAAADANIKTIVLKIESPGGQVQGIAELADTVRDIAKQKRVIAYTGGLCCSCAYWVASQTSRIYSSRLADVGCIGTLYVVSDWSKYHAKMGVDTTAITSTGAETYKGAGAFGTEITAAQKADFKRVCDECQVHFTQAIATGRFTGDVDKAQALATGQVHVGPAALALGLVDEIVPDTFDAWLSRLSEKDGVDYDAPSTDPPPAGENALPATDPPNDTMTAISGGKDNPPMTFEEFKGMFAQMVGLAPTAGTAPVAPPAPSAAETELAEMKAEQLKAQTAQLTARKESVQKIATTAFTGKPALLASATTAIEAATTEESLTSLEGVYQSATPATLTTTGRLSSSQQIDEPTDESANGGAPGKSGINTSEIYASRAKAMGQTRQGGIN